MRYAELERSLGEIDRARAIFVFASQYADPRSDPDFWKKWKDFEIQHGNEDTFREMLRISRSVSASYSQVGFHYLHVSSGNLFYEYYVDLVCILIFGHLQTHFILPEYLMQKDQKLNLEEAVDTLKRAGVPEDEMAALERQLAPAPASAPDGGRVMNFVSAGVESQPDGRKVAANNEDIELPEESDSEDEKIEIAQKDVPAAVFGDLARKAAEDQEKGAAAEDDESTNHLGALERIKRQRRQ